MNNWTMFAHKTEKGYQHFGSKKYVECHLLDYPIVEVVVTEDSNGEYFGWLEKDSSIPTMIWTSFGLFDMCFTYGSKAEETAGRGRVLRLSVRENSLDKQDNK